MSAPEALPTFKYHPDPIATGSVRADADTPCLSCNRIRGYVYTGPAHSAIFHYLSGCICPWCVADGSAARQFRCEFVDTGTMDGVTQAIRDEIAFRTPGFTAWQEEQWLTCCNDAAAFLGLMGAKELKAMPSKATAAVKAYVRENFDMRGEELKEFMEALSKEDQPTAYLFQCLHCQKYLAFVDET